MAVELLVPGDQALALRGPGLLPVLRVAHCAAAEPLIQIAAGAFGPGRPHRPLRLGIDHPVFIGAVPVAAGDLVNGASVLHATAAASLFHVDLGHSDVLLVEGVPVASAGR